MDPNSSAAAGSRASNTATADKGDTQTGNDVARYDVVVVGAGMVGAALALGLRRSGYSVAMIEKAPPEPLNDTDTPDLRVSAISVGSERYLRSLGVWDEIVGFGVTPYCRLSVWDDTPHPLSSFMQRPPARTTFDADDVKVPHLGHIIENRFIQMALWQGAEKAGVVILAPAEVAALDNPKAGKEPNSAILPATVTLKDGSSIASQLIVGADGANSHIRQLAGIGTTRNQYGQQALVACVQYAGPVEDITWQAFHPTGPRAFLPLHSVNSEYSWASLVWYDRPERLEQLKALSAEAFLETVQRNFPKQLPPLSHLGGRASFPIARQHAHHYFSGRVVLAGDSAHTVNPLAGQGVNLGFQDAEALQSILHEARRSQQDPGAASLLTSYEAERRPTTTRMMQVLDLFYYLFSNAHPPLHLLRNLGLGMAQAVPTARNQVCRYAMGLDSELPRSLQLLLELRRNGLPPLPSASTLPRFPRPRLLPLPGRRRGPLS